MKQEEIDKNSTLNVKSILGINPKNKPLTVPILKSFEGCEH